jgi:BASS family bile acid:Na+ symporter
MNLIAVILLVLKVSIMLSVFAIGLKATFAEATFLFRRPSQLFRAFLSMNVLMPLVALALAMPFDLHPAVKIALVVISVSPTPPIFPKKAHKAGGKDEYDIGLLVAAAVLAVILIPITLEILEKITGVPLAMPAVSVALLVLTTILAPLLVGMAVRKIAPAIADRVAKPIGVLASVLLILSALPVLIGMAPTVFSFIGDGRVISLAAFALAGLIIGHLLGGPEPENRPVLALATSCRHPAVALAIAHANFPNQKLTAAAVFLYVISSAILSALYLAGNKRQLGGDAAAETRDSVKA